MRWIRGYGTFSGNPVSLNVEQATLIRPCAMPEHQGKCALILFHDDDPVHFASTYEEVMDAVAKLK